MILQSYKLEALEAVLGARIGALDGQRPRDLMDTADGRARVYNWALGLADGVMD